MRWLYWEPDTDLLDRNRAEYFPHVYQGNKWIEARQKQPMEAFDRGYVTRDLADNFGNGLSSFFPMYLRADEPQDRLQDESFGRVLTPNTSDKARTYLETIIRDADVADLFHHVVATLHAPAYRDENGGALRQDWPRIPLPDSKELLLASAALGKQIAALLDTETPFEDAVAAIYDRREPGGERSSPLQTGGETPPLQVAGHRPALQKIAVFTLAENRPTREKDEGDLPSHLSVTAGWGHRGKGAVPMAGQGGGDHAGQREDYRTRLRPGRNGFPLRRE